MPKTCVFIILLVSSVFSLNSCIIIQQPANNPSTLESPSSPSEQTNPTTVFTATDISTPEWSYEIFNAPVGGCNCSYRLIEQPIFDQENKQVKWIAEFIPEQGNPFSEISQINFAANFEDKRGVILETVNLEVEGEGNTKRYILRIPESIWQRWSEVAKVNIIESR
jgi:hypothetical protein